MTLTLEAEAGPGYRFSHWQADGIELADPKAPVQQIQLRGAVSLEAILLR